MMGKFGSVAAAAALLIAGLGPAQAAQTELYLDFHGLARQSADGAVRSIGFGTAEGKLGMVAQTVWGTPLDTGTMEECGAGPIDYARYANGMTLHFQDGAFVGWATGEAGVTTPDGIGVGTSVGELQAGIGALDIYETTLGLEFDHEDFFGIVSAETPDGVVWALWGGTSCNFR